MSTSSKSDRNQLRRLVQHMNAPVLSYEDNDEVEQEIARLLVQQDKKGKALDNDPTLFTCISHVLSALQGATLKPQASRYVCRGQLGWMIRMDKVPEGKTKGGCVLLFRLENGHLQLSVNLRMVHPARALFANIDGDLVASVQQRMNDLGFTVTLGRIKVCKPEEWILHEEQSTTKRWVDFRHGTPETVIVYQETHLLRAYSRVERIQHESQAVTLVAHF